MIAPPEPWTKRARINTQGTGAKPLAIDPTMNTMTPSEIHALAPVLIAQGARGQRQSRFHESIGAGDPLLIGETRADGTLDAGKRQIHDRDVEHGHEGRKV